MKFAERVVVPPRLIARMTHGAVAANSALVVSASERSNVPTPQNAEETRCAEAAPAQRRQNAPSTRIARPERRHVTLASVFATLAVSGTRNATRAKPAEQTFARPTIDAARRRTVASGRLAPTESVFTTRLAHIISNALPTSFAGSRSAPRSTRAVPRTATAPFGKPAMEECVSWRLLRHVRMMVTASLPKNVALGPAARSSD